MRVLMAIVEDEDEVVDVDVFVIIVVVDDVVVVVSCSRDSSRDSCGRYYCYSYK